MEKLEVPYIINLTLQTLEKVTDFSLTADIKEQITEEVLETIENKKKIRKYTSGSQDKVIESLRRLGGSAIRADIASDSGLDPNVISALLSKLVKRGKVEKIPLEKPSVASGRGLNPEYVFKLVAENGKAKTTKVARKVS